MDTVRYATAEQLHPEGADCEQCELLGCPIVPGYGPTRADLVVVGEAPGDTEVRVGMPFVGPSGELLRRTLQEAGVDPSAVYYTNAVLCRPSPHRAPAAAELRCCEQRLVAEVVSRSPKAILVLGTAAWKALMRSRHAIGAVRGIASNWRGIPVVPSWHPAYVLRNPAAYSDFLADLRRVAALLTNTVFFVRSDVPRYQVADTTISLHAWLDDCSGLAAGTLVALDVETASDGRLLCVGLVPVGAPGRSVLVVAGDVLDDPSARWMLSKFLREHPIVAHNAKFDYQALLQAGIDAAVGGDTLLMSYLLNERAGRHGLKRLCQERFGAPDWEEPVRKAREANRMEDVPRDVLYAYNATDVAYTALLYKSLESELDACAQRVLRELLLPATPILARMEAVGVALDRAAAWALKQSLDEECGRLRQVLAEAAGCELNPNSWQQVAEALYDKLGLPKPPGGSLTSESVVERLLGLDAKWKPPAADVFLQALLDYRRAQKLRATYVESLLEASEKDGRVHAQFNLSATVTGRLSSSKPNLQNQPKRRGKEIRDLFVATPGYTLLEADLSQAELRVLAGFSGDQNLIAALASGDPHRATAALIFHKRPEEVTDAERNLGKTANFAVVYGAEASRIAEVAGCSIAEAQEIVKELRTAYRVAMEWLDTYAEESIKRGYTITPFGRKRHFPFIPAYGTARAEMLREIRNTPIQSVASDICLTGLIRIGQRIDWERTRLLLTVHDSLLLETQDDPVAVGRMVVEAMTQQTIFPNVCFEAEVKMGKRWGSLEEIRL